MLQLFNLVVCSKLTLHVLIQTENVNNIIVDFLHDMLLVCYFGEDIGNPYNEPLS